MLFSFLAASLALTIPARWWSGKGRWRRLPSSPGGGDWADGASRTDPWLPVCPFWLPRWTPWLQTSFRTPSRCTRKLNWSWFCRSRAKDSWSREQRGNAAMTGYTALHTSISFLPARTQRWSRCLSSGRSFYSDGFLSNRTGKMDHTQLKWNRLQRYIHTSHKSMYHLPAQSNQSCHGMYMWPFMHKSTVHRKILTSSFSLHHPLTKLLLITMMSSFLQYDLLFSSYTTVSVIQLKMYILRWLCPFPIQYSYSID